MLKETREATISHHPIAYPAIVSRFLKQGEFLLIRNADQNWGKGLGQLKGGTDLHGGWHQGNNPVAQT
jgi:hypothetical protein